MKIQQALFLSLLVTGCSFTSGCVSKGGPEPVGEGDAVRSLEYLEAMRLAAPDGYLRQLEAFILGDRDPYVKERGVAVLTALAIRKNETERVVGFLKTLAEGVTEENVRTSAYAHIELLRTYRPVRQRSSLELSVSGTIGKGETVTLTARISSTVDIEEEVVVGISSLHQGIELLDRSEVQRVFLRANEPRDVEFALKLRETGSYFIPVAAVFSFDRVDHEKIEREGYLVVEESGGRFLSPEEQPAGETALVRVQ